MQIEMPPDLTHEKSEIKEMLSMRKEGDRIIIDVNYSSLSIIQTCMRKAQLALNRNLQSGNAHAALIFGSGFHKAMETWYCAEKESRKIGSVACDDSHALMLSGQLPLEHGKCARCASVFAFLESAGKLTENDQARSPESGINILNNYFDVYLDDPFELVVDADGPLCERAFKFKIHEREFNLPLLGIDRPIVEVWFFGQIDSVLRNKQTGEIIVCDHKTTSSLGKDFFNRIKPNFQYTGYWWAAKEVFGLKPTQFMVNGVQVAKTKQEVKRQFTSISDAEIEDLKEAILWNVGKYLQCVSSEMARWPMSSPDACSMWGGCNFKRVCELPRNIQESMISAEFNLKGTIHG